MYKDRLDKLEKTIVGEIIQNYYDSISEELQEKLADQALFEDVHNPLGKTKIAREMYEELTPDELRKYDCDPRSPEGVSMKRRTKYR
jgi:hypothetical protein